MPRRSRRRATRRSSVQKCENRGVLIPAGLFMGLGVGVITGQVAGFLLIGLGLGFLFSYFMCRKK